MSKLEQIKALRKDKDIQFLLDAAYEILLNPIAMFDTNYSLLAYTDVKTDDPIWNELVSTGTFCLETQKFFANEYFTYYVTNADKIVVLKSDELKYDRVLAHVFNRDKIKVALLVMVECNTPFTTDDLVVFSAFADKLTAKIRNDEHFTAYGRSYHDTYFVKLLDGEIKDTRIYSPHIQILYDGFNSYLYVGVITVKQSDTQQGRLEYIRGLLAEKYKSFKFAIYSGFIVMVMSSKNNNFNAKSVLGKFDEFFAQNDILAGISSSFESLYELRMYYDEAVMALKNGIDSDSDSDKHVFMYDD